jgi:DUF2924 family protein
MMGAKPIDFAQIRRAGKAELVAAWTAIAGESPPFRGSAEVLAMALAWRLQAQEYGGLKPSVERKLEELAGALRRRKSGRAPSLSVRPGTVMLKEWRSQQHRVTVLDRGFAYQGRTYRSLSEIAREITGTRWNGPAFFGLRNGKARQTEPSRGR